ncbi:MAG: type III pantothenate kinase, partial [Bacilli bacterium]|nr:type III pantothenate kinase [Bacilli bacterium]
MILGIDIGNTNIVIGIFDEKSQMLGNFRIQTNPLQTTDEFGVR